MTLPDGFPTKGIETVSDYAVCAAILGGQALDAAIGERLEADKPDAYTASFAEQPL